MIIKQWHNTFLGFLFSFICFMPIYAYGIAITIQSNDELATTITQLSEQNKTFQDDINNQKSHLSKVNSEQAIILEKTSHVQETLKLLDKQGEWLSFSTALGDTLRLQLLSLPDKPKLQALDTTIADAKVAQLSYSARLDSLNEYPNLTVTAFENGLVVKYRRLLKEQKELLKTLVSGSDTLILELTKLNIASNQLIKSIDNANNAAKRYFFWVADVEPLSLSYPLILIKDIITVLFSVDTLSQLSEALLDIFSSSQSLLFLLCSILLIVVHFKSKIKYNQYLEKNASRIGKVKQDSFSITLKVVAYSLLMALPIPLLWSLVGFALQTDLDFPVAVAFGHGVNSAAPILWVFIISAQLAAPNGLFLNHFNWPSKRVKTAMKYYQLSVWVVIPLVVILMSFDQFNNRQYAATIGRFCFILLCFALVFMTNAIHRARVPLYIDKKGSGYNLFSRILWVILLSAPWIAIIAACLGYLSTAQVLLGRLEASVIIWLALLVIYFMIRRWMLIQRRRIEYERTKQRRLERLAQRNKSEEENDTHQFNTVTDNIEEPIVDLDIISAKSLQLVRSILVMFALISMILLWSELYSAFSFMDNITLWGSKAIVNGVEVDQYISLSSIFIAILIMILTVQLVKNLPALLELVILQHLDLTPGTGYAILTVSKYVILVIGCLIGFSFIGIDWSKIQWLIAALGVGLGFGLQEIFANFISGLIMLFEKPVRIGDTVTIRNLTGTITKINTRATTIVDWDRKEIIMPNKAFITEQLVNWSLSDAITRIVLTIPASINAESKTVIDLLLEAAKECEYVLDEPQPEVYLVDIQEGIQLYELRVFAQDMGHRMPLRSEIQQLIIQKYHNNNLELPFPPLQTNLDSLSRKSGRRSYTVGTI